MLRVHFIGFSARTFKDITDKELNPKGHRNININVTKHNLNIMKPTDKELLLRDVVQKSMRLNGSNGDLMDIAASMFLHIFRKSGLSKEEIYEYIDDVREKLRKAVDQSTVETEDIVMSMEEDSEIITNKKLRRILMDYPPQMEMRLQPYGTDGSEAISDDLKMKRATNDRFALVLCGKHPVDA